jgi:hypothetical protein
MVKVVSCLVFVCGSFLTSSVYSQTHNSKITHFSDLVAYLEKYTQCKFAYPQKLNNVSLEVKEGVNLGDPVQLQQMLALHGIDVVIKGDLLIFRKRRNITKKVSGFVRDAASGEALIGANVIDLSSGKGVSANAYGYFSLDTSGDSIAVSFVGYAIKKLSVKDGGTETLVALEKEDNVLEEVMIVGSDSRDLPEMSTIRLSPETIKSIPVFMGETDLLKTLQLLPGVQAASEGTAGFQVRGGGPDQNLILLDGVPVYNANHLF